MDEPFADTFSCSAPPHKLRCVHCIVSSKLFHGAKAEAQLHTVRLALTHVDGNIHRRTLFVGIEHPRCDRLKHAETVDGINALLEFVGICTGLRADA